MPAASSEQGGSATSWTAFLRSRQGLRYALILGLDAVAAAAALQIALLLRFEGSIPAKWAEVRDVALPFLLVVRLIASVAFGLHRWSFRFSGLYEALRLLLATASGSAGFVAALFFLHLQEPPRSVILLEFFLTSSAMALLRFSPRMASAWAADGVIFRRRRGLPTLIVGAGSAGDLLLRDLRRSSEHDYDVIGFIDDDPRKSGHHVGGRPVLGGIDSLPALVERHGISRVLIAVPRLPAERIQAILKLCASLKVRFQMLPVSFTYLNDRATASMLQDLSAEDLLPRQAAVFDSEEIRALVSGRRILVTGAAGSIGGEIARQLSAFGPERLVLVDMNENDLYFLYRELRERRPELKVFPEIANVREEGRLAQLGAAHRPHDVFHAAAHKHVPLMEDAPEEAVKNNVFGTLHVARMADRCGVERFVLISSDKAVHPASVMGATKRVAELLVRDLARSSRTRFTAVRFGNVLGSSGSVVPLFKKQIERGGPVTVTDPECTRYFMTIPEAAGLVLLAGLNAYGDLCVLDMGQPIRIADLARHMITMAGLVPGADIRIEYTGLRPGEKLSETLLTYEEEKTRVVRSGISVATSPETPPDLDARLEELRLAAERPDREALLRALGRLVPTLRVERGARDAEGRQPPAADETVVRGPVN